MISEELVTRLEEACRTDELWSCIRWDGSAYLVIAKDYEDAVDQAGRSWSASRPIVCVPLQGVLRVPCR